MNQFSFPSRQGLPGGTFVPILSYQSLVPMLLRCARACILVIAFLFAGACSGPTTIPSSTVSQTPSVDGSLEEWNGRLTRIEGKPVSMAAHPTDSLLYVAVLVQDRALIQSIAANGLVTWVDPTGGQRRAYGVQYPLGLRRQRAGQSSTGSQASQSGGLEDVSLAELEVMRGEEAPRRIPARYSSGLRGNATLDPASLICEIAIPVGTAEYGLRTSLGKTVGLGLKIPKPEDEESSTLGGQSVSSAPGRRNRRRRRRRRQPQQSTAPERPSLDLWVRVGTGSQSE